MPNILVGEAARRADPDRVAQVSAVKAALGHALEGRPAHIAIDALMSAWLELVTQLVGAQGALAIIDEVKAGIADLALVQQEPAGRA